MSQDYLVDIRVHLPQGMSDEERSAILREEVLRGRELRAAGAIQRIWRVPGALRNVGIWRADDATALHESLASLPLIRFLDVSVTPLALHPVEAAPPGA